MTSLDEDVVRETVDVVDREGDRHLRQLCAGRDVVVEEVAVRAPDPVLLLALIGSAATVSFVLERWHDRLRGGQVVDLRPGAPRVAYRDGGLAHGYVIVYAVDGTVSLHVHEPPNQTLEIVKAVVEALGGMTGKGVGEVAAKAEEAAAGQAAVTVDVTEPPAVDRA